MFLIMVFICLIINEDVDPRLIKDLHLATSVDRTQKGAEGEDGNGDDHVVDKTTIETVTLQRFYFI